MSTEEKMTSAAADPGSIEMHEVKEPLMKDDEKDKPSTSGAGNSDPPEDEPLIQQADHPPEQRSTSSEQTEKGFRSFLRGSKKWISDNKAFAGCIALNIILIICILGVTIGWLVFNTNHTVGHEEDDQSFCLTCSHLKLTPDDKTKYFPGASDKCCSEDLSYVENALEKQVNETLNDKFREKPLFQMCLNSSTAEHPRNLIQMKNIKSTEDKILPHLQLIIWDETNPIKMNIDYFPTSPNTKIRGSFKVKRAGYYKIYSNLVFNLPADNTTVSPSESVIRHLVLKYRSDYEIGEKLMEGYSTLCDTVKGTMFNSYVSGEFFLETTDFVKVFVNNPRNLAYNDPNTAQTNQCGSSFSFFGMYLI